MLFGSPGSGRKLSTPTELRSVQAQRPMSWLTNELVLLRSAGCSGMLPLSATLCCHWRHSRCTIILPLSAIQSCHLIRSGLDCQIQRSAAAWRLRSEQQSVRCGLPVIRQEPCVGPEKPCRKPTPFMLLIHRSARTRELDANRAFICTKGPKWSGPPYDQVHLLATGSPLPAHGSPGTG
jgi:hypothetical protein